MYCPPILGWEGTTKKNEALWKTRKILSPSSGHGQKQPLLFNLGLGVQSGKASDFFSPAKFYPSSWLNPPSLPGPSIISSPRTRETSLDMFAAVSEWELSTWTRTLTHPKMKQGILGQINPSPREQWGAKLWISYSYLKNPQVRRK